MTYFYNKVSVPKSSIRGRLLSNSQRHEKTEVILDIPYTVPRLFDGSPPSHVDIAKVHIRAAAFTLSRATFFFPLKKKTTRDTSLRAAGSGRETRERAPKTKDDLVGGQRRYFHERERKNK